MRRKEDTGKSFVIPKREETSEEKKRYKDGDSTGSGCVKEKTNDVDGNVYQKDRNKKQ